MADGTISIDVELNEKEFRAALENMGGIVKSGAETMLKSVENLSGGFSILPDTIDSVFKPVPQIISGVINKIASHNPIMTKTGEDLFMSLTEKMPGIIDSIAETVPGITDGIIEKITGVIPDMTDTGNKFFNSLISDIPGITDDISGVIPEITGSIIEKLGEDNPLMSDAGYNLFAAITGGLPSVIEEVSKAPGEIAGSILGVFAGFMPEFNNVGANMVTGVWTGISGMASWLSSQVTGFFSGIIGGVKSFLGISSPSKLFRDTVGRNIASGIGAGISAEMPRVIDDSKKHMKTLIDAANQSSRIKQDTSGIINRANNAHKADTAGIADIADIAGMKSVLQAQISGGNKQNQTPANINVTLEPSGDIRGFFEYISAGVKRADYLNGTGAKT